MEKVLDLKVPGVTELSKKELKEVDGGTPWHVFAMAVVAIGATWKKSADKIHEFGEKIGEILTENN